MADGVSEYLVLDPAFKRRVRFTVQFELLRKSGVPV